MTRLRYKRDDVERAMKQQGGQRHQCSKCGLVWHCMNRAGTCNRRERTRCPDCLYPSKRR